MNFVLEMTPKQIDALVDYYQEHALSVKEDFVIARFKLEGVVITVYRSGKVMFQGDHAEEAYLFWQDTFNLTTRKSTKTAELPFFYPSIGSDESGSGDYFGPLVAAAVAMTEESIDFLNHLAIQDSKTLSDTQIKKIAPQLLNHLVYSLNVLPNEKYNELVEKGYNLNKLKAYLHAQCHKTLLTKLKKPLPIVIDQFCSIENYKLYLKEFKEGVMPDHFYTKAESHFASVAAASIIARYVFLERLDQLGKAFNINLEKGASARVESQAKKLVKTYGVDILHKIAKSHFKTTKKVIEK